MHIARSILLRYRLALAVALFAAALAQAACRSGNSSGGAGASTDRGSIRGIVWPQSATDAHGTQLYIEGLDRTLRTDEAGAFKFEELEPGNYTINAERSGYESVRIKYVTVVAGRDTDVGRHEMAPLPIGMTSGDEAVLIGWAFRADKPLHDGIVVRLADDPARRAVTDPDGGFFLGGLKPGDLTLVVMASGYEARREKVLIEPGVNRIAEEQGFILTAAADSEATHEAVMEAEEALARLPVEVAAGNEAIYGRAVLSVPDAMKPELYSQTTAVLFSDTLEFYAGLNARGEFVFPRVGAGQFTVSLESDLMYLAETIEIAVAPGENTFVVLSPDLASDVAARAHAMSLGIDSAPDAEATAPEQTEGESGAVLGLVTLEDRDKLLTARLSLLGTSLTGSPDLSGAFAIEEVPPGTYSLSATADDHLPFGPYRFTLEPGQRLDVGTIELLLDVQHPKVIGMTPPSGSTDVLLDEVVPILIEFDQEMNGHTLQQALRVSPDLSYNVRIGDRQVGGSSRVLRLEFFGTRAEKPLEFYKRYTIEIADTATSVDGVALEAPFSGTFQMGGPSIIDTYPADGDERKIVNSIDPAIIYTNSPIDTKRDVTHLLTIRPTVRGGKPILRVYNDTRTGWGTIEVLYGFEYDTNYRIRVEPRLYTKEGKRFANLPYTFSFAIPENKDEGIPIQDSFHRARPREVPGRSR